MENKSESTNKSPIKWQIKITIDMENTLSVDFLGAETLPAGRLEGYMMKATRKLKSVQGRIRHERNAQAKVAESLKETSHA